MTEEVDKSMSELACRLPNCFFILKLQPLNTTRWTGSQVATFMEPKVQSRFVVLLLLVTGFSLATSEHAPNDEQDQFLEGTFPDDFEWGFATSAYQIEGGHDADDKGESIWDEFSHRNRVPSTIKDGTNGDIACDSYHKYKEDVQLLKNTGADYYRFSLSWPRILPKGTPDKISWEGITYYNNLINELLAHGIKPMVTLYHWDLPHPLQEIGGWENDTLVEHFTEFSRVAYGAFGDRVKLWLTFNEPWVFCVIGYGNDGLAPGVETPLHAHYQCVHTVLKAHASSYHLYNDTFKPKQNGVCGITLDANWYEPASDSPVDITAAERTRQFKHGWLGSPLFFGKYPDQMREFIDRRSEADGLPESRLPVLDEEWSMKIKGSLDYLGLNHYTTELIAETKSTNTTPDWWGDQETDASRDPSWARGESDWLYVVPWGFRKLLNWIKETYGNPPLYVTENGFSEGYDAGLNDINRTAFYRSYINEMLKAVVLDSCNVKSYAAWSLLDNFEWSNGYTERFGVHWVNFSDPQRPRVPKDSAKFLTQVFADNGFPASDNSGSLSSIISLCHTIVCGLVVLTTVLQ